jgi:GalNAc5-diNAcBac-PP-undecaprenol beta-1,3-glucosyltransferase
MNLIPKVTIIMATYNRAHFIMETLLSVQIQTFKNWECLIVDDGGSDNTQEIISAFLEQDNRFQFLKRPDSYKKGLPGCRNYGLDLCKGEFVIFFDDDDVVHPANLKVCLEAFEDISIDFCHYQKNAYREGKPDIQPAFFEIKQKYTKADIAKVVNQEIGLASCTVLWKKKCFDTIRFNENLLYAEEWECYLRILSENYSGIIINTILYYNRKHPNSNTGEFYIHDPVRRESYVNAILLVVQNLKEKQLLSASLKRYFVTLSKDFTEYKLFKSILNVMDLPTFEKLKWQLFYLSYPIRLPFYKIKKALQK